MISPSSPTVPPRVEQLQTPDPAGLREAATGLEAAFLAEMLKAAGLGRTPDTFGGGAGETQFASYLREAQARAMAESGGIGLAEQLFRALQQDARDD
ncbi:rod-binding protein [Rhodosalinus sp.]|uniref:rod-binding protein n=1 Tax=Rhodosalinus sp. TaxID=2047741 RepID=UPI0035658153